VRDIYRIVEDNTRFPQMLMGDLESQLAGCLRGRDMMAALVEKYGLDSVRGAITLMWDRSEAAARAAIRKLPDGVYENESFLDNDGLDFDKRVPIKVVVTVAGDEMTVDFSGVAEQVRGSINSGRHGGAETAARIAFKYLAAPDEPANDGSFRALKVVIPDGKFLSAGNNAAMAMYSSPIPTVIDTVVGAMVKAAPDRLAAGHHSSFAISNFAGRDPETGALFYNLCSNHGGWGGSRGHDGPGPYKTMSHGDTLDVPSEVQEALYPLRVESQTVRVDSAGAGEWRGGWGLERIVTATAPCTVQLNFERVGCPPWGVLGGRAAPPAEIRVETAGGTARTVMKGDVPLAPGDRVRILTAGGGGYGDPLARDPARVAEDVRLGYVSPAAAQAEYGVAVDTDGRIDAGETARLRGGRDTLRRHPPA
jgi:N-methylhydantoinase B